jgi:hypothetical protein
MWAGSRRSSAAAAGSLAHARAEARGICVGRGRAQPVGRGRGSGGLRAPPVGARGAGPIRELLPPDAPLRADLHGRQAAVAQCAIDRPSADLQLRRDLFDRQPFLRPGATRIAELPELSRDEPADERFEALAEESDDGPKLIAGQRQRHSRLVGGPRLGPGEPLQRARGGHGLWPRRAGAGRCAASCLGQCGRPLRPRAGDTCVTSIRYGASARRSRPVPRQLGIDMEVRANYLLRPVCRDGTRTGRSALARISGAGRRSSCACRAGTRGPCGGDSRRRRRARRQRAGRPRELTVPEPQAGR